MYMGFQRRRINRNIFLFYIKKVAGIAALMKILINWW